MNEKLIEIGVTDILTREYLLDFINGSRYSNNTLNRANHNIVLPNHNIYRQRDINNILTLAESLQRTEYITSLISEYRFLSLLMAILDPVPDSNSLEDVKVPLSPEDIHKLRHTEYHKGDSDDKCGICYSELEDKDKIIELPCKHVFHTDCIMPWIRDYHHVCPSCKIDIREHI